MKKALIRTVLATVYFNPIWIFRHLAFVKLFTGDYTQINSSLFSVACWSFLINIPISFVANHLILNKIKPGWRFSASAIFSGLMAIYYAMSENLFQ